MSTQEYTHSGRALPANWRQRIIILWSGQTFSILSTFAASFAAMWFITETTSSALILALAGISFLLPIGLLSPFGGIAADRFNRKKVMILADGTVGVLTAILAILVITGSVTTVLVLVLLIARGCAQAFHGPALMALAPQLVPERHLVRINTLDQMLSSGAGIIGPILGMFLYSAIGFEAVLLLDSLCAAIACSCLAAIAVPKNEDLATRGSGVIADLKEGIVYLAADKGLVQLMVFVMLAVAVFAPLGTLYPLMTYEWFGGDGYQAALVEAISGIGLLAGSILLFVWGGGKKLVPVIAISGIAIGVFCIACGLLQQNQFVLFVVLAGLVSAAMGVFNGPILPILQKRIDEEKTGRIMGLFLTGSTLATPVGLLITGFGAEFFGLTTWFIVCGSLLCLVMVIMATRKTVRALDSSEES